MKLLKSLETLMRHYRVCYSRKVVVSWLESTVEPVLVNNNIFI